jgi:hypothetical protein
MRQPQDETMARAFVLVMSVLTACTGTVSGLDGGSGGGGATGGGGSGGGSTGGMGGGSTGGGSTGGGSTGGGSTGGGAGGGGAASCLAGTLIQSLGRTRLLVGGTFDDAQATASWDVRYLYLSGSLFDGASPCASCATSCTVGGTTCANTGPGCAWWGCWQYDVPPPGDYARGFVTKAKTRTQLPMFTYYLLLQASGRAEGTAEVAALNDQAFLTRYFNDWRFLLQQVGSDVALLHLEPDFWGYAQQLNANPHLTAAKVTLANPADCATQENSAAGFGRCLIAMARKYAPNAKVGLHASGWATSMDALTNTNPSLDVAAEAVKTADFLEECGADADFVVVDASDRDAGYYQSVRGENRWWDATNATLPNFTQAFAWAKALAERMSKPVLWWQVPIGNAGGNDTPNHYRDNRVDYLFGHLDEVARAHGAGVFFGAGQGDQTTAATDDGNLISKVNASHAAGGQVPCP